MGEPSFRDPPDVHGDNRGYQHSDFLLLLKNETTKLGSVANVLRMLNILWDSTNDKAKRRLNEERNLMTDQSDWTGLGEAALKRKIDGWWQSTHGIIVSIIRVAIIDLYAFRGDETAISVG